MKGERRKSGNVLFIICMLVMLAFGSISLAEGTAVIVETCTNERDVSIYVKDAGSSLADAAVQIGTASSSQVQCQSIQDTAFETLILLDNSLSIPKEMRSRISGFLRAFIDVKAQNEKIAIGVFSRDITYLTDFTSDYDALQGAAEQISYQNQDTYITDMLYELLREEYYGSCRDVYRRIIIIADGVDDESLGYTIDELKQLIKEDTYPIYTIGCRAGNNDTQLENLFALSRQSNAAYFLLDSEEDVTSAAAELAKDKEIVKVVAEPPADLMDGSVKTVKINFQSQSVSKEVRMPQQEKQEVIAAAESEPEMPADPIGESEESSAEETSEADEEALRELAAKRFIMCVIAAWIGIIIIIFMVCLIRRYKKKQNMELINAKSLMEQREQELSQALPDIMLPVPPKQQNIVYVLLTDVYVPKNSFKFPVSAPIVIGRSNENCQLAVEHDKSVSGRHCVIYIHGGKVMVRDLGSTNGTFVNGHRISGDTELASGSTIALGNLKMRFDIAYG